MIIEDIYRVTDDDNEIVIYDIETKKQIFRDTVKYIPDELYLKSVQGMYTDYDTYNGSFLVIGI